MDSGNRLKLDQTFEAQKDLVNATIVPTVMESLDMETFPVSESIVREMIHNRHKHQREEYKIKQKSESFQDQRKRKKHMTSRRNDVSNEIVLLSFFCHSHYFITQKRKNRANTIRHLENVNDPLIMLFEESELRPIKDNAIYHSPEISETDDENNERKRKIVTKDLEWRSSTVRLTN